MVSAEVRLCNSSTFAKSSAILFAFVLTAFDNCVPCCTAVEAAVTNLVPAVDIFWIGLLIGDFDNILGNAAARLDILQCAYTNRIILAAY